MHFSDKKYSMFLQKSLASLRENDQTCDLMLIAEKKILYAHRILLAASSPYFRILLYDGYFVESKQNKISVGEGITFEALKTVLTFIYTSEVFIDESTVFDLYVACDVLQIAALKRIVCRYIDSTLCRENCIDNYIFAKWYRIQSLKKNSLLLCTTHFTEIMKDEVLLKIPFDVLLDIASSKFIRCEESDLLQAILMWVLHDLPKRQEHVLALLEKLDMRSIPKEKADELSAMVQENNDLAELIRDFFHLDNSKEQKISNIFPGSNFNFDARYQNEKEVLIVVGGNTSICSSRTASSLILGHSEWTSTVPRFFTSNSLTDPGNPRVIAPMRCNRENAATASENNQIYVAGGRQSTDGPLAEAEMYDHSTNTWQKLPDLPEFLQSARGTLCQGQFIVTGGSNFEQISSKVWKLHKKKTQWVSLPPMPEPRHSHGIVSFYDSLYVMGGITNIDEQHLQEIVTDVCYRFDEGLQQWCELSRMPKAKAKFGCAIIPPYIYTIGGVNQDNSVSNSVERYDIFEDSWAVLKPMLSPRHSFGITLVKGRIFCIGGHDFQGILHTVDYFNTQNQSWHSFNSMHAARSGLAAATLYIPSLEPSKS